MQFDLSSNLRVGLLSAVLAACSTGSSSIPEEAAPATRGTSNLGISSSDELKRISGQVLVFKKFGDPTGPIATVDVDEDGSFADLPVGEYDVVVLAPGHAPGYGKLKQAEERADALFVIEPTIHIAESRHATSSTGRLEVQSGRFASLSVLEARRPEINAEAGGRSQVGIIYVTGNELHNTDTMLRTELPLQSTDATFVVFDPITLRVIDVQKTQAVAVDGGLHEMRPRLDRVAKNGAWVVAVADVKPHVALAPPTPHDGGSCCNDAIFGAALLKEKTVCVDFQGQQGGTCNQGPPECRTGQYSLTVTMGVSVSFGVEVEGIGIGVEVTVEVGTGLQIEVPNCKIGQGQVCQRFHLCDPSNILYSNYWCEWKGPNGDRKPWMEIRYIECPSDSPCRKCTADNCKK